MTISFALHNLSNIAFQTEGAAITLTLERCRELSAAGSNSGEERCRVGANGSLGAHLPFNPFIYYTYDSNREPAFQEVIGQIFGQQLSLLPPGLVSFEHYFPRHNILRAHRYAHLYMYVYY